jgi:hypothetical protein
MQNLKSQLFLKVTILVVFSLIKNYNNLDYCCCLFRKDPFRGFLNLNNKIMSFDHTYYDKESMGYKMINQCYRQNNGFPSFENINNLKNNIFTKDIDECEKECQLFVLDLNEKYNIIQEQNRDLEAKRLNKNKRQLESFLQKKILKNSDNLYSKRPRNKNNISKNDKKVNKNIDKPSVDPSNIKKRGFSFVSSHCSENKNFNFNDSDLYDLSSDSDNIEGLSYLDINNPKYNIQMLIDKEKMNSK